MFFSQNGTISRTVNYDLISKLRNSILKYSINQYHSFPLKENVKIQYIFTFFLVLAAVEKTKETVKSRGSLIKECVKVIFESSNIIFKNSH